MKPMHRLFALLLALTLVLAVSPAVTAFNDAATGKVKLTWKAVTGAVGYRIYRAESKYGTYKAMKTTIATSYTNTSAKAGKTTTRSGPSLIKPTPTPPGAAW